MEFAHGAVQWLSADAATTTYTVSGLSFQPKALRFYWVGLQSAADAVSEAVNERRGVGFAVSPSDRAAVGTFSQDTAATSNCGGAAADNCVAVTTDGAGVIDGRLDLNSIASDGFQLIVDDAAPADITVFWEAWGGDDITSADVGYFTEPAGTGNQDYSVPAFEASSIGDQVVMFAGCQSTAGLDTGQQQASGLHVGFATSSDSSNVVDQVTVMGSADDASGTMDTDGHCSEGQCLSMVSVAGAATLNARAVLTQFNNGGFRLNWVAVASTGRPTIYLAIKGGSWEAGHYIINGASAGATATVAGLPFTPKGISLIGRMTAEQAATATTANDRIGLGSGSSTSSRRSMGVLDEDGTANTEIDATIQYDQVLCFPSTSGTLQAAYDINAMNADGFQIIVDTGGGVANEWQGYLAFGNGQFKKTATLDAFISPWEQLDAYSQTPELTIATAAQSATATLDAAVRAALSLSASLDAAVRQARSATATIDGAVATEGAATGTLDGVVEAAGSASATLDAAIRASLAATATLDALVQAGTSLAATIDAAIEESRSGSTTLDAALATARTAAASLDAAIRASAAATASLDAALRAAQALTASADAAIEEARSLAATLDAAVEEARSASASLDAQIEAQATASATMDAAIRASAAATASLDAQIQAGTSASALLDAAILVERTAGATIDGVIEAAGVVTSTLDAALRASRSATASIDAAVRIARSAGASLDALIEAGPFLPLESYSTTPELTLTATDTATATMDAAIEAARTALATLDAFLQTAGGEHPVDAPITRPHLFGGWRRTGDFSGKTLGAVARSASATLDAAIEATQSASAALDAAIEVARSAGATLDSAIAVRTAASATIDAAIEALGAASSSMDAAVRAGASASASLDVRIVDVAANEALATLDAAVQAARSASVSLDAVLVSTTAALATLDAAILEHRSASASADAAIRFGTSASATVDAMLASGSSISVSLDAAIAARLSAEATLSAAVRAGASAGATLSAYIALTGEVDERGKILLERDLDHNVMDFEQPGGPPDESMDF